MMSETLSTRSTVVAVKDQVSSEIGGEAVILHLGSGTYYGLDEVGNRIWDMIQEPRSVEEVRAAISEEYEVDPDRCEEDIILLLRQLADERLIEVES